MKPQYRLVRAKRELDLITPVDVIAWAADEVANGREEQKLVELAALWDTSAEAVDARLDALLVSLDIEPPSRSDAGRLIAGALAQDVVDGVVSPYDGARSIWLTVAAAVPEVEPELRAFVGLASEWADDEVHRVEYDADIVDEAKRYVNNQLLR